jgi:Concanavalin A-like lectin/glucanases superfamily
MKHHKALKILFALVIAIYLPAFAADDTAVWLAQNAKGSDDEILLPDSSGSFDFGLAEAAGVTIGGKPGKAGDAKSIEFSGKQTSAFKTVRPFPQVGASLSLSMQVRASETSGDEDGTIIRYGTQWEVRYDIKKGKFVFIVWSDDNVFTTVSLPAKQGAWQTLKATVSADSMTLSVDGEEAKGVPKGGLRAEPRPALLVMGGSLGKELTRKFIGSVAEIRIALE